MESISNTLFMLEVIALSVVFIYQVRSFTQVGTHIGILEKLIPSIDKIKIFKSSVGIGKLEVANEEECSEGFKKLTRKINRFLEKSKGSVDGSLNIFRNLINREVEAVDNLIESQISAPLYLGLAGTLIGICFGLIHLVLSTQSKDIADLSNADINNLFISVALAVLVSLLGLLMVIINTNFKYKVARLKSDNAANEFISKIEIDLLPEISESTTAAVYSLRENLNNFNQEFGKNLNDYKANFGLINENLRRQEEVLKLLSRNNLAETAKEIAVILVDIRDVAENFKIFKSYQKELLNVFSQPKEIAGEFNQTLGSFTDFNQKLTSLNTYIEAQTTFNQDFQAFLKNNFPESQSAKEIYEKQWREVGTRLIKDIADSSKKVSDYFSTINGEIVKFSFSNQNFFNGFKDLKGSIDVLIKNSVLSYKAFEKTHQNMTQLAEGIKSQNNTIIELSRAIKSANSIES